MKRTRKTAESVTSDNKNNLSIIVNNEISFTPHIFRHTYATNLYYADIDMKRCQYLLGHSSIEMTLKVYTHIDNKNNDKAAEKIDSFFNHSKISQV